MDPYEIATSLITNALRAGKSLMAARAEAQAIIRNDAEVTRAATDVGRELKLIEDLRPPAMTAHPRLHWYTGLPADARYWPAYQKRLVEAHWTPEMLEPLSRTTDRVVSFLGPPGAATIDTRGLVVGRVQSGKTAHFAGVIAKAADCNYRFFIILTGMTNALRLQTQKRLDRDLGKYLPGGWNWLTKCEAKGDFADIAPANVDVTMRNRELRTIAVVKKNSTVLGNLRDWIKGGNKLLRNDCPVLIIDDEADQASVPTGAGMTLEELNDINGKIVEILQSLPKCAYLGYTATPFANVLIDPTFDNNLYPRSFIFSLPTPSGYFGAERIFGRTRLSGDEPDEATDGLTSYLRTVPDIEVEHLRPKRRDEVEDFRFVVTPALDDALRYFHLATAARLFRERNGGVPMEFSTMLIHTSERVSVHRAANGPIGLHRKACLRSVRAGRLKEWERLWSLMMKKVDCKKLGSDVPETAFSDLRPYLEESIDRCELKVWNSDRVDVKSNVEFEKKGQILIVIGGNTLSRGMTLEGLIVSFFVRTANAYDTLLQMGRWFGYRPGYEDLPRVWMTGAMKEQFFQLATVEEEFRNEIERNEQLGKSPLEAAPRIRRLPQLRITAPNKMRSFVDCETSFGGQRLQTIWFNRDKTWLDGNLKAAKILVGRLMAGGAPKRIANRLMFRGATSKDILHFLSGYRFHDKSRDLDGPLIRKYIEKRNLAGGLRCWNVVVYGRQEADADLGELELAPGVKVAKIRRTRLELSDDSIAYIKALMAPLDILADQKHPTAERIKDKSPDELFSMRTYRDDGVLILYPISEHSKPEDPKTSAASNKEAGSDRKAIATEVPVIGVGMLFPSPSDPAGEGDYVAAKLPPASPSDLVEEGND